MINTRRPRRCLICGHYLTLKEKSVGNRCVEPGHWQAAGRLAPRDFYLMARMVAEIRTELEWRCQPTAISSKTGCCRGGIRAHTQ